MKALVTGDDGLFGLGDPCTPEPVYVELGLVQNKRPEVTELLSTREVMPGLPAAVSIFELAEWLPSHHTP